MFFSDIGAFWDFASDSWVVWLFLYGAGVFVLVIVYYLVIAPLEFIYRPIWEWICGTSYRHNMRRDFDVKNVNPKLREMYDELKTHHISIEDFKDSVYGHLTHPVHPDIEPAVLSAINGVYKIGDVGREAPKPKELEDAYAINNVAKAENAKKELDNYKEQLYNYNKFTKEVVLYAYTLGNVINEVLQYSQGEGDFRIPINEVTDNNQFLCKVLEHIYEYSIESIRKEDGTGSDYFRGLPEQLYKQLNKYLQSVGE